MGYWPHKFAPDGAEVQIGEEKLYDDTMRRVMAQPMICVHCSERYIRGKESQPTGQCPARTDESEAKRLGVDRRDVENAG